MNELEAVAGIELWQWWRTAKQQAIAANIPVSDLDWFLQELSSLDRLSLRLESFKQHPQVTLKLKFADLKDRWQQRLSLRKPVQYLAGSTPWRQFTLQVSPAVLIPRPETEILIDLAIALVKIQPDLATGAWADLGTGSGAIAIGLADAFPNAVIHASDISAAALQVAQANAARVGLSQRIHFHQGSWFEPIPCLTHQFSGIISNPPYIPTSHIHTLQPEVNQHEPHLALDGGADGLNDIRHLIHAAPAYLQPGGIWMVEMMAGQAETIAQILAANGNYEEIQIQRDFADIERFAIARRK